MISPLILLIGFLQCFFIRAAIWPTKAPTYPGLVLGHSGVARPATRVELKLKRQQSRLGSKTRAADITAMTQFRGDHLRNLKDDRAIIIVPPATKFSITSAEARQPIGEWRVAVFKQNNVTDPEYWQLSYNGQLLDDATRIDDPSDGSSSNEPLVPYGADLIAVRISKPPRKVVLQVKGPTGTTRWLEALPVTTTIGELSNAVANALGLERDTFDLFVGTQSLDDHEKTLEALGIATDTTILAKYREISVPVQLPSGSLESLLVPLSASIADLLKIVKVRDESVTKLTLADRELIPSQRLGELSFNSSQPIVAVSYSKISSSISRSSGSSESSSKDLEVGATMPAAAAVGISAASNESRKGSDNDLARVNPVTVLPDEEDDSDEYGQCVEKEVRKLPDGRWRGSDLLKRCCEPSVDGIEQCASNEETLDVLLLYYRTLAVVFTFVIIALIILVVIIQTFARNVVQRLIKAEDRYMRELVEAAFRQISVIAIASAVLHIVCTWDVIQVDLDRFAFDRVLQAVNLGRNFAGRIDFVFGQVQLLVDDFILVYAAFVLLFAALAYTDFKWLKKAEDLTVEEIVVNYPNTEYIDFVTARYEYIDRVAGREIAGLDPKSCWFMEYYRACLILTSMTLVRLPNFTLLLLLIPIGLLTPAHRLEGGAFVLLLLGINVIPIIILIAVLLRASAIHRQVMPADPLRYASIRYQLEAGQLDPNARDEATGQNFSSLLRDCQPRYKSEPCPSPINGRFLGIDFGKLLFGTHYPNRHEALFIFKRKGPSVLLRATESAYLICMLGAAYTMNQIDKTPEWWWYVYGYWPTVCLITLVAITAAFLPKTLSLLTYISSTGMMLKEDTLSDVMITNRSLFVSRLSYFIDGLRIEALLRQLRRGSADFWAGLAETTELADADQRAQRAALWERLTHDTDDVITPPVLFQFLNRQGLNIPTEEALSGWFEIFDKTQKGGIGRGEFDQLIVVLTEMLREPLDIASVRELLVEGWNISPMSVEGINAGTLAIMLTNLNMKWTESQKNHLITFLAKDSNARSLSFDQFLQRLAEVEASTLSTLNQAVQKMRDTTGPSRMSQEAEEPELRQAI